MNGEKENMTDGMKEVFDEKTLETLYKTLKRGKTIELKLERGRLVFVGLDRKVILKTSING